MTSLESRMALMDLYGLRLNKGQLFGKETGQSARPFHENCELLGGGKRGFTKEFRRSVVKAAAEALAGVKKGKRWAVINRVASSFRVSPRTLHTWLIRVTA